MHCAHSRGEYGKGETSLVGSLVILSFLVPTVVTLLGARKGYRLARAGTKVVIGGTFLMTDVARTMVRRPRRHF